MAPNRFVAALLRPWADSKRLQYQECWAREDAAEANLNDGEARVLAAKYASFSPPEIASAHGRLDGNLQEILADLNDRARQASDENVTGQLPGKILGR